MRFFAGLAIGVFFTLLMIVFLYPKLEYRNSFDFTNGSIQLEEGIEHKEFGDTPARINMRANQMRPNKQGVCDIKTGKVEFATISLEHLNMLDHFAYRYLETHKSEQNYNGECRLIIDGKEVEGRNIK